jgi:hypothetical protein
MCMFVIALCCVFRGSKMGKIRWARTLGRWLKWHHLVGFILKINRNTICLCSHLTRAGQRTWNNGTIEQCKENSWNPTKVRLAGNTTHAIDIIILKGEIPSSGATFGGKSLPKPRDLPAWGEVGQHFDRCTKNTHFPWGSIQCHPDPPSYMPLQYYILHCMHYMMCFIDILYIHIYPRLIAVPMIITLKETLLHTHIIAIIDKI